MIKSTRLANLPPYAPIEPFDVLSNRLGIPAEQIIKLDANENPFGSSPKVAAALGKLTYTNIYPDPESRALRSGLSAFTGTPMENLLAGAGADELIDLLLRVLLEPGELVLNCPPTFGMYSFDTLLNNGQLVEVPRNADFSLDLPAIFEAVEKYNPRILFLTAPNNPDGNLPSPAEIDALLEMPLLVVVDEAYVEFADEGGRLGEKLTRVRDVPGRENLVVLRTFSKWAGLAGLRVGYGAFPSWLIPIMWKAKQPYNVNVAASTAALASLQDLDWLAANVAQVRSGREKLFHDLGEISYLRPFPSQANFILCKVVGRSAADLKNALANLGILTRHYNTPLLRDFLRISVGRPEEMNRVLETLKKLEGEPWS